MTAHGLSGHFQGSQLRLAREHAGLDFVDMAHEFSPLDPFLYTRWERHSLYPGDDITAKLARRYRVQQRFFFGDPAEEMVGPVFVCPRPGMLPECQWCRKIGVLLCDHLVVGGGTCDALMCYDHAHAVAFEVDWCPQHASEAGVTTAPPPPVLRRARGVDPLLFPGAPPD